MKRYNRLLFLFASISVLFSCQKVIELDLKESDPFYVIEGEVNKDSLIHTIYISKSKKFSSDNQFDKVSDAIVSISDDVNNVEILTEASPGVYKTSSIVGEEGVTYTLNVQVGEVIFTSTSKMPTQVMLDSLIFLPSSFGGDGGKIIVPSRFDPPIIQNNYKFDVSISRFEENEGWVRDSAIMIQNDDFSDGLYSQQPIFGTIGSFLPKDTCRVTMKCIDANVYKYFFSLSQNDGGSATPANPISNISGGALGYFSAQTKQTIQVVVPE